VNLTLFPPARASWLARNYPFIVIEHVQHQGYLYEPPAGAKTWGPEPFVPPAPYAYFEEAAAVVAAQIKALNASAPPVVLYYINANSGLPWYRLSAPLAAAAHPEWRLHNACHALGGDAMAPYAAYDWDLTQAGVKQHFVDSFVNTTDAFPSLDGIYVDQDLCTAVPAQWAAVREILAAMQSARPDLIVGFDTTNGVLAGNNGFRAAMDYSLTRPTAAGQPPPPLNSGSDAVRWLQDNGEAGVISLAHDGAGIYNYSLSVFLAGAHASTPSYYAFSAMRTNQPLWMDCWDGGAEEAPLFPTWCAGMGDMGDYSRPLGQPLGDAQPTGRPRGEVTRAFAAGTRVTVELLGAACEISWGDGHRTVCN